MAVKNGTGSKVEGLDRTFRSLGRKRNGAKNAAVTVGYKGEYALPLHENVEMKWRGLPRDRSARAQGANVNDRIVYTGYKPNKKLGLFWGPSGQAKFLEQPARQYKDDMAAIARKVLRQKGATMVQALTMAGMFLQRKSMELVPRDTSALYSSAFTEVDMRWGTGRSSPVLGALLIALVWLVAGRMA